MTNETVARHTGVCEDFTMQIQQNSKGCPKEMHGKNMTSIMLYLDSVEPAPTLGTQIRLHTTQF
jgi:hypothetical protein